MSLNVLCNFDLGINFLLFTADAAGLMKTLFTIVRKIDEQLSPWWVLKNYSIETMLIAWCCYMTVNMSLVKNSAADGQNRS